nr:hypothetical protein [Tanacetum cinerariifolium]
MLMISSLPQERCINSYQSQGCLFGRELKISAVRNIVTSSRVTPSWREIVSLTFSEAGILHEAVTVADFNEALLMEEKFLKQKAKITWLKERDSNIAYFHKVVKSRVSRSRIDVVTDAYGNVHQSTEVAKAFIDHYEIFLGQPGNTSDFNTNDLFLTTLDESEAFNMVCDISSQEVKSAMFSMGNDKSPGLDGFTAAFFEDTWDIVGVDVIKAVKEFFTNGRLLKELNHTIIALIPKVNTPARVTNYRPISCCNVLFKCISKIIVNRLKSSLKRLISPNQSAYVSGRCISDNILLTQEIMHNYHLDRGVPRSKVIKDTLNEFKDASGLNPSMPKRKAYFCNVINNTKLAILNILPFEEDRLPVKYLGVPLVSSRLISKDYNTSRGKVKVAWDVVCLSKQEGGLGIRRLDHFNKALMVSHVWKLLSLKESLWVKWIHVYKLKNRSFWDISYRERLLCGLISGVMRVLYLTSFHLVTLPELVLTMLLRDGMGKPFSVHNVWDSIRPGDNLVPWCDLVWFHACIPRHAFNMWLILKQRLRTQDCLRSWENAGLTGAGPSLATIIMHLLPIAKRKFSMSCIGKLVVAAVAYFIWHERAVQAICLSKERKKRREQLACLLRYGVDPSGFVMAFDQRIESTNLAQLVIVLQLFVCVYRSLCSCLSFDIRLSVHDVLSDPLDPCAHD